MKKIRLLVPLLITLITFEISAKEISTVNKSVNEDKKENMEGFSKWSIIFSLGRGRSQLQSISNVTNPGQSVVLNYVFYQLLTGYNTPSFNPNSGDLDILMKIAIVSSGSSPKPIFFGHSDQVQFKAEYRPKYIGLQFGMSTAAYKMTIKLSPLDNLAPVVAAIPYFPPSFINILPYVFYSTMQSNQTQFNLNVTTLDMAATFHMLPKSVIDPYANIGVGAGTCGTNCFAGKQFVKLGFNINLGDSYIFIDGQRQRVFTTLKDTHSNGDNNFKPIYESMATIGFGLYL